MSALGAQLKAGTAIRVSAFRLSCREGYRPP